ncbi:MAG: hypothetical protein ACM3KL_06505 [Alphaproteobacteria bacterium]
MKHNPASLLQFKTTTRPLLITIALLLACFATAFAIEPTNTTFHFEFPEAQYCNGTLAGTGFTQIDIRIITFYNQSGDPIRLQAVSDVTTLLGSVTNNETVSGRRHNLLTVDLQAGTETHFGLDLLLQSSAGPIQVNAGTLAFDSNGNVYFVNGPHPFFDQDPNVPVCDVLTGP